MFIKIRKRKNPSQEQTLGYRNHCFQRKLATECVDTPEKSRYLSPKIRFQILQWSKLAFDKLLVCVGPDYEHRQMLQLDSGCPMPTTTTHSPRQRLREVTYPQHSICTQVLPLLSCWQAWQSASVQNHWICLLHPSDIQARY